MVRGVAVYGDQIPEIIMVTLIPEGWHNNYQWTIAHLDGRLQRTQSHRALLRSPENQPRHRHPLRPTRRELRQHGPHRRRQISAQICPRRLESNTNASLDAVVLRAFSDHARVSQVERRATAQIGVESDFGDER